MHIFGPVPSRRLGLSLGVDLLKGKSCNLNCVYCELGRSLQLVNERQIFVNTQEVLAEVREFFTKGGVTDYVTISGSGEPTLALNLGEVIEGIRGLTDKKIALITNGALLYDAAVRREAAKADLVMPSVDAVTQAVYIKINRPHGNLKLDKVVEGLKTFGKEYKGAIWVEVMVVNGINDTNEEMLEIKKVLDEIPTIERIQINTVVRSRAETYADPVTNARLVEIKNIFGKKAEVIGTYKPGNIVKVDNLLATITEAVARRPMTIEDLAETYSAEISDIREGLKVLEKQGKIKIEKMGQKEFYVSAQK